MSTRYEDESAAAKTSSSADHVQDLADLKSFRSKLAQGNPPNEDDLAIIDRVVGRLESETRSAADEKLTPEQRTAAEKDKAATEAARRPVPGRGPIANPAALGTGPGSNIGAIGKAPGPSQKDGGGHGPGSIKR